MASTGVNVTICPLLSTAPPADLNIRIHLGSRSHYVTTINIIGEGSRNEFGSNEKIKTIGYFYQLE